MRSGSDKYTEQPHYQQQHYYIDSWLSHFVRHSHDEHRDAVLYLHGSMWRKFSPIDMWLHSDLDWSQKMYDLGYADAAANAASINLPLLKKAEATTK